MQQNNLSVYEQIKRDSYSLGTFVLVLPNNTLFVTYRNPTNTFKAVVLNLEFDGSVNWSKEIDGLGINYHSNSIDSLGNVYLCGVRNTGSNRELLVKINPSGEVIWQKLIFNDEETLSSGFVRVDKNDNIYMGFQRDSYSRVIVKFDSNMNVIWSRKIDNVFYAWFNNSTPWLVNNDEYIAICQYNFGVFTSIVLNADCGGIGTYTVYTFNQETASFEEISAEYSEYTVYTTDLEFSSSDVTIVSDDYNGNTVSTTSYEIEDIAFENFRIKVGTPFLVNDIQESINITRNFHIKTFSFFTENKYIS
jgi:hypothetical protein